MRKFFILLNIILLIGCDESQYAEIIQTESKNSALLVQQRLLKNGIAAVSEEVKGGYVIQVDATDRDSAFEVLQRYGLFANTIPIDTIIEGRFGSVTKMDQQRINYFDEMKLRNALVSLGGVVDAHVVVDFEAKKYSVSVMVISEIELTDEEKKAISAFVVGSKNGLTYTNTKVVFLTLS